MRLLQKKLCIVHTAVHNKCRYRRLMTIESVGDTKLPRVH
jgi:hypothetical protein